MRIDDQGYIYFIDRIGDTLRWKGENVARLDAVTCGVSIAGAEGRSGTVAMVIEGQFEFDKFSSHLARCSTGVLTYKLSA